jgi:hypothetical protein
MKIFLATAFFILWAGVASANPWLVCDPQNDAAGYSWTIDGSGWTDIAYSVRVCPEGPCADIAELGWVSPGQHTMQVIAFGVGINPKTGKRWESDIVPFSFRRPLPPDPAGGKLVRD